MENTANQVQTSNSKSKPNKNVRSLKKTSSSATEDDSKDLKSSESVSSGGGVLQNATMWVKENPMKASAIGLVVFMGLRSKTIRSLAFSVGTTLGAVYLKDALRSEI